MNVYAKASEVIAKYGHNKGDSGDQHRGYCLLGALHVADPNQDFHIPTAARRVTDTAGIRQVAHMFNDNPSTTKADVLRALDITARKYSK